MALDYSGNIGIITATDRHLLGHCDAGRVLRLSDLSRAGPGQSSCGPALVTHFVEPCTVTWCVGRTQMSPGRAVWFEPTQPVPLTLDTAKVSFGAAPDQSGSRYCRQLRADSGRSEGQPVSGSFG